MHEPQQQWPHELDEPSRTIPADRDNYMAQMLGSLKQIQVNTRRNSFATTLGFLIIAALMVFFLIGVLMQISATLRLQEQIKDRSPTAFQSPDRP